MKEKMIIAVRIYDDYYNGPIVMAEIKYANGDTEKIVWNHTEEREKYSKMMNGYTFFYDERVKPNWNNINSWI